MKPHQTVARFGQLRHAEATRASGQSHHANSARTGGQPLRIISGRYKGRALRSPASPLAHPMGSREKLALFNMLQPHLAAAKVLDLYAGSGALGIEALSRGAAETVFVEQNRRVADTLRLNLAALSPATASPVPNSIPATAAPALSSTPATSPASALFVETAVAFCQRAEFQGYFDIIFADPPYDNFHPEELANVARLLAPSGIFALSSPANLDPPALPGLAIESTHTYAAARLTLYRASA